MKAISHAGAGVSPVPFGIKTLKHSYHRKSISSNPPRPLYEDALEYFQCSAKVTNPAVTGF